MPPPRTNAQLRGPPGVHIILPAMRAAPIFSERRRRRASFSCHDCSVSIRMASPLIFFNFANDENIIPIL